MLLAIEGPDRAGKTTCAKRLAEELGFIYIKLPNRQKGMTGPLLQKFVAGELSFSSDKETNEMAAQLIFAANMMEHRDELLGLLSEGKNVVVDRYVPSARVYHSNAVGYDATRFIHGLYEGAMPVPDLILIFEIQPEVAALRADFGKDRNDDIELQRGVGELYRKFYAGSATFVNAERSPDEVFATVVECVKKQFKRRFY